MDALLVVADKATPTTGDDNLEAILTGLGFIVTLASDEDAEQTSGFDVVVISESCNSTTLGTKYKDSTIPTVNFENGSWDAHNYIANPTLTNAAETQLDVTDDIHEVSGGLSGLGITFLTSAADLKHTFDADLPASAQVVLSEQGLTNRIGIAYESGASIHNSDTTESRRVLLGFTEGAVSVLNPNGEWIIEQSIRWATQLSVGADFSTNGRRILFVHGTSEPMPADDETMADRMRETLGYRVTSWQAADVVAGDATGFDLVAVSKTVLASDVTDKFKSFTGGFWTYEDNLQAISISTVPMMAFIDLTDPGATAWHGPTTTWFVESVTTELTGGLSGLTTIYTASDESTYAPVTGDNNGALPAVAIRVAEFDADGDGRFSYYAYESGDTIADGTTAAGRRVFFGIYDNAGDTTFDLLTADGLTLFDASLDWAAGSLQITPLFATGTQTITDVVDETDGTTDLHLSVDDDPDSPDDADWVNNAKEV